MKIGVIFGSPSVEYLGSCVSGTHVADVLSEKHDVKRIHITMEGDWEVTNEKFTYADKETNRSFYSKAVEIGTPKWKRPDWNIINSLLSDLDIVVPQTHGPYGECGMLQGFLDILGIPYTGPGVEACALTQNKDSIKILAQREGVPVSNFLSFDEITWKEDRDTVLKRINKDLKYPLFVKPNDGGSSIGISKVRVSEDLHKAIEEAFRFSKRVIVEEGVDAYEVECGVIGTNKLITPNEVGEVVPSKEFYDIEAKYFKPSGLYVPAKNVNIETRERIKSLAKQIYRIARSRSYSRVDFLVDKKTGTPYLTEFTALPGCTELSLFPQLFVNSGWKELDLWEKIIEISLYEK